MPLLRRGWSSIAIGARRLRLHAVPLADEFDESLLTRIAQPLLSQLHNRV